MARKYFDFQLNAIYYRKKLRTKLSPLVKPMKIILYQLYMQMAASDRESNWPWFQQMVD